jgi:hypothetical protein
LALNNSHWFTLIFLSLPEEPSRYTTCRDLQHYVINFACDIPSGFSELALYKSSYAYCYSTNRTSSTSHWKFTYSRPILINKHNNHYTTDAVAENFIFPSLVNHTIQWQQDLIKTYCQDITLIMVWWVNQISWDFKTILNSFLLHCTIKFREILKQFSTAFCYNQIYYILKTIKQKWIAL